MSDNILSTRIATTLNMTWESPVYDNQDEPFQLEVELIEKSGSHGLIALLARPNHKTLTSYQWILLKIFSLGFSAGSAE